MFSCHKLHLLCKLFRTYCLLSHCVNCSIRLAKKTADLAADCSISEFRKHIQATPENSELMPFICPTLLQSGFQCSETQLVSPRLFTQSREPFSFSFTHFAWSLKQLFVSFKWAALCYQGVPIHHRVSTWIMI